MVRRRLGLVSLAIIAFLVGSEIALQIFGLGARIWLDGRADGSASTGTAATITLLCVGDSHTYGAPLPRIDSYPSQLEAKLRSEYPDRDFRVLNRGVPGVNSAFVANRLEQQILKHQPDMILVWAGTNNRWNALETEAWEEQRGLAAGTHRALLHLKLYRLARVAWFSLTGAEDAVAVKGIAGYSVGDELVRTKRRPQRLSDADLAPGLAFDMERMVRTAEAFSTPILFVTYPKDSQLGATEAIRATGDRLGVPVVDSRESLRRALAEGREMGELIVYAAGPHPTALLYAYVVEAMLPRVTAAVLPEPDPQRRD
jgi:hypothetical protein